MQVKSQKSKVKSLGFTLMEITVSTAIFAGVLTMMLVIFNYTLRIQRRTEALRKVSQDVRNITEFLAKEVRNGQIDYGIRDGQYLSAPLSSGTKCPQAPSTAPYPAGIPTGAATYNPTGSSAITNALGLINVDGERECIYWDNDSSSPTYQSVFIEKENYTPERLHASNVKVILLKFYVRPEKDPYTDLPTAGSSLAEVQPMVTILVSAKVTLATGEIRQVNYQTSVSTNLYNIPNQ